MLTLALSFNRHDTLRLEELAGAALVVGGVVLLIGGLMPLGRRFGQIVGGILVALAGVLFILAVRYGVNP